MKNTLIVLLIFISGLAVGWLINFVPVQKQVLEIKPSAVATEQKELPKQARPAVASFDAQMKFIELMSDSGFRVDEKYQLARSQLTASQRAELDKQLLKYAEMLFSKKQTDTKVADKLGNLMGNESTDKNLLTKLITINKDKKHYSKALELLLELQHVAQFSDEIVKIDKQIKQVVDANIAYLRKQKEPKSLERFYKYLIENFPSDYAYRWRYAKHAYDSHQYDRALYLMEELRYMPEYSQQVSQLTDSINFRLNNNTDDGVVVGLVKKGDSYFVKAIINDYEPVNLLIDTGASMTVISPELAYSLGVFDHELDRFMNFQTANGEVAAPVIELAKLKIGAYMVEHLPVGILPINDNGQLQGLLGMNFLKKFKFFIDQQNLSLELLAQP